MTEKTILLVEDNPNDEMLALRALRKHNVTNAIHVVRDGAEALDYLFGTGRYAEPASRTVPALILLDLNLPKLSGLEVLRRIRADKRTQLLLVVMLTTSKQQEDVRNSYQLGCNSYVVKPVDFIQFTDAVRQLKEYWLRLNELPPTA